MASTMEVDLVIVLFDWMRISLEDRARLAIENVENTPSYSKLSARWRARAKPSASMSWRTASLRRRERPRLRTVFSLFSKDENGVLDFEEFKDIAEQIMQVMNDDKILEMLHSMHINHKTSTNQGFTFEEFYSVFSKFSNKWSSDYDWDMILGEV